MYNSTEVVQFNFNLFIYTSSKYGWDGCGVVQYQTFKFCNWFIEAKLENCILATTVICLLNECNGEKMLNFAYICQNYYKTKSGIFHGPQCINLRLNGRRIKLKTWKACTLTTFVRYASHIHVQQQTVTVSLTHSIEQSLYAQKHSDSDIWALDMINETTFAGSSLKRCSFPRSKSLIGSREDWRKYLHGVATKFAVIPR